MSAPDRPGRRLKVTLVARDETDDPSILDIVRRAIEDGLRTPATGATTPPAEPTDPPERHAPVGEDIETEAREAVERALAKVVEEFQAAGKEPKFDPAKWAEQLSKVWAAIRRMKARGVELELPEPDPHPPAGES